VTLRPPRPAPRIAVVGATGAVGGALLELIEDHGLRYRDLHLLASSRSAGRRIPVGGQDHTVRDLDDFDFAEADLAFFAAGADVSAARAPGAATHGTLVIDSSDAFRRDPATPLVVPQINPDQLLRRPPGGVIAGPDGATVPLVRMLHAVERRWGVHRAVVSTYQAASHRGHQGVEELLEGSELALQDPDAELPRVTFDPPLAFNVVPLTDRLTPDGSTLAEQRLLEESRRILGRPDLEVTATCVQVPVVNGHGQAVWVQCRAPVKHPELTLLLARQPEVTVHDGGLLRSPPSPLTVGRPDHVHIGRLRVCARDPREFWAWLVADNLRTGAALNAVRIAEVLSERGLV
jgi:aspartate-semialdehyde dehydrogenase